MEKREESELDGFSLQYWWWFIHEELGIPGVSDIVLLRLTVYISGQSCCNALPSNGTYETDY